MEQISHIRPADGDFRYKFGSLSHTGAACARAGARNVACIRVGEALDARALRIWGCDGSNFPGQSHLGYAFERYVDSIKQVAAALPPDWSVFLEPKMYRPAFYPTVVADRRSSPMPLARWVRRHAARSIWATMGRT